VKSVADNVIYHCDGTSYESVYRCFLGITVTPSRLYTVYDEERGVVYKRETVSIASVENDGLASGVLRAGDVINSITVDGVKYDVYKMYIVTDVMLNARIGSAVYVNITRGEDTFDVQFRIDASCLTQIK
jgi:hypothetical protein